MVPHDVQSSAVAPPVAAMYLPAAQSVQTVLPVKANLPEAQDAQSAPDETRNLPASHAWRGVEYIWTSAGSAHDNRFKGTYITDTPPANMQHGALLMITTHDIEVPAVVRAAP